MIKPDANFGVRMKDRIALLENNLKTVSNTIEKIDMLNELSQELIKFDIQKSKEYGREARQLSTSGEFAEDPYQEGLAKSLNNLCDINVVLGDSQKMFDYGHKAMALYKTGHNLGGQANVLSLFGRTYLNQGNHPEAVNSLLESLALARQANNKKQEGYAIANLASVYYYTNNNSEVSIDTFNQAIEIYNEINDEANLAITYNNMAVTFNLMGEYEKALESCRESLKRCEKLGMNGLKIILFDTIGAIYLKMDNFEQAEKYLNRALDYSKKTHDRETEAASLLNQR